MGNRISIHSWTILFLYSSWSTDRRGRIFVRTLDFVLDVPFASKLLCVMLKGANPAL